MKRFIYFLIPVILSLVFIQCYAFIVPDVKILGKDPEITGIEPKYLIPGNIGKIKGNNFFEFPQNANKLFINNKRVKILKSTNDTIEFIVPKIKLGNANIRFYTKYLGYESKSVTNSCKTTFNGPILSGINTNAVSPGTELQLSGNFSKDKDLFLNINGVFLKAKELSKNSAIFLLPDKLPEGIFKINGFYRIYDRTKTKYFDSAPSEDLILFNGINAATPNLLSFKYFMHLAAVASLSTTMLLILGPAATSKAKEYFDFTFPSSAIVP